MLFFFPYYLSVLFHLLYSCLSLFRSFDFASSFCTQTLVLGEAACEFSRLPVCLALSTRIGPWFHAVTIDLCTQIPTPPRFPPLPSARSLFAILRNLARSPNSTCDSHPPSLFCDLPKLRLANLGIKRKAASRGRD